MATNYIEAGDERTYTNSGAAAIASGDVVIIGTYAHVALVDIAIGATGAVKNNGVFSVPKLATDAFTDMEDVYWDATAGNATVTATGNTLMGKAFGASAANSGSVANVLLNGLPD